MPEAMVHPVADHLPPFITAPGATDYLLVVAAVSLIILLLMFGSLYFRLHSLPERIAHGTSQLQFQLVAVLTLLALFTHNSVFWFAALLLAIVPIPNFWTPLAEMSESLAKIAGSRWPRTSLMKASPETPASEALVADADPMQSAEAEVADNPASSEEDDRPSSPSPSDNPHRA